MISPNNPGESADEPKVPEPAEVVDMDQFDEKRYPDEVEEYRASREGKIMKIVNESVAAELGEGRDVEEDLKQQMDEIRRAHDAGEITGPRPADEGK